MQALMHLALILAGLLAAVAAAVYADREQSNHHHHHGHHHHRQHPHAQFFTPPPDFDMASGTDADLSTTVEPFANKSALPGSAQVVHMLTVNKISKAATNGTAHVPRGPEKDILKKMKQLEVTLTRRKKQEMHVPRKMHESPKLGEGQIFVNGPLPTDFSERFAEAVSKATGASQQFIHVTSETGVTEEEGVVEIVFKALPLVVKAVESQAADADSKLAKGMLHSFLVARSSEEAHQKSHQRKLALATHNQVAVTATPDTTGTVMDIDTEMPYGDLEPFGREDTAQELTESSVKESDSMVDQLERAEVAEEKRAVFRSLTRLRGAAITSFDGVARSQTGNIDEYNKIHKWRNTHPLHHLADEESDIAKWAFPDNADF